MTKNYINWFIHIHLILFSIAAIGLVKPMYSQSLARDTTFHPYHVNYWITGGILVAGVAAEKIGVPWISDKSPVTNAELLGLERSNFTAIDRWALKQDASSMSYYITLSDNVLAGIVVLPVLTMLDNNIRHDWLNILLLYAETVIITNNLYLYTPFGPTFQNRLRPVVYYEELGNEVRTRGANRNSFYSGHVASAASASFFTAKIFCDYHPDLGWEKYLIYGAAAIPPLVLSYIRLRALSHFPSDIAVGFGIGALCGILIPEFHRIKIDNTSLGLYSSFEGTGISLKWQPDFGK